MNRELREILLSGTANRQTIIHFPNGQHEDITHGFYSGSLKLDEILCSSENINFGECNASKFEAQITGIDDISNLIIQVYQKIPYDKDKIYILVDHSGNKIITSSEENILLGRHKDYTIPLFYGRVDSAILQADRINRVITAYDELYFNGDKNCADWYSEFFKDNESKTLKNFRDSLFRFIGIEQEQTSLVNDSIILEETLSTTQLKFIDVIKAVCQINGCFGHIDRNGIFRYIRLGQTGTTYNVSDNYRSNDSTFEQYIVKKIDKLQVNSEEGDIGSIVGTGDNPYIIQGNFLIWGKGASDLNRIATNVFNVIKNVEYRPYSVKLIYSEPYITVGDRITLTTNRDNKLIESYVLNNSFDSVQLFGQTMFAEGDEYRDEVVDDVNVNIIQLRNKTLKITQNVDELSFQMTEVNGKVNNLTTQYSEIKQQANGIELTVSQTTKDLTNKINEGVTETKNYTNSQLKLTADSLASTVAKSENKYSPTVGTTTYKIDLYGYVGATQSQYPANTNNGKYYLNQSDGTLYMSNGVTWLQVAQLELITSKLSTSINQSAEKITLAINTANSAANAVANKVSKGDISTQLSLEEGKVAITGDRISITSEKFKLTDDGHVECHDLFIRGGNIEVHSERPDDLFLRIYNYDEEKKTGQAINLKPNEIRLESYYYPEKQYMRIDRTGIRIEHEGYGKFALWGDALELRDEEDKLLFSLIGGQTRELYAPKITATFANLDNSSDFRLKQEIKPIDNNFKDLYLSLNPKQFKFQFDRKQSNGLIAQEVLELCYKFNINPEEINLVNKRERGYYSLNYNFIHNISILLIQELCKRMEEVENAINKQRS